MSDLIVTVVYVIVLVSIVWAFVETIIVQNDPAPWENHHYDIEG